MLNKFALVCQVLLWLLFLDILSSKKVENRTAKVALEARLLSLVKHSVIFCKSKHEHIPKEEEFYLFGLEVDL